jgi:hypothetical protein
MVKRALALAAVLLAACVPELPDTTSQVTGPRLLAVASLPAEAAPPAPVSYHALYVAPPGAELPPASGLSWAFCNARLALTDEGTVSPSCIAPSGASLQPIGDGLSAGAALPMNACRAFGPDVPVPVGTQPPGRPVDPDPTGGYYQPVRVEVPAAGGAPATYVVGTTRIQCGVAGATATVSAQYNQEYRNNENPALASLTLVQSSGETTIPPGAAPGVKVQRGASVTLRAAWAACPTTPVCGDGICGIEETAMSCPADCKAPKGCTGSEQYVLYDTEAMALQVRREAIQIAWFTTGGTLGNDTSGRSADEAGSAALNTSCQAGTECIDNAWTAPSTAGEVLLWVVVRDDRGGVGWQSYRVDVE